MKKMLDAGMLDASKSREARGVGHWAVGVSREGREEGEGENPIGFEFVFSRNSCRNLMRSIATPRACQNCGGGVN